MQCRSLRLSAYLVWSCAVCALAGPSLAVRAADTLESFLPPKDTPAQPRLLVLKTGQVLTGTIEAQIGGYTVHSSEGSVIIQYTDVRTAAVSLEDAYQRMAANQRDPTANERIELAQWCVRVGLPEHARDELLAALALEPERLEARRLLIQIEAQRTTAGGAGIDVTQPASPLRSGAPAVPGQLSRERVAEFTRQIQPLLLNTCGNAACHAGNQAGDFHLRPTARISRLDTSANLNEVLRFIDPDQPDASPLLVLPRQRNGAHAKVFLGPGADDQYARLTAWVRQAAQESRPARADKGDVATPSRAAPPSAGTILPAAAFVPAEETPFRLVAPPAAPVPAARPAGRNGDVDDSFLRHVLEENRADPFDPEEFNRRVHGAEAGRPTGERR